MDLLDPERLRGGDQEAVVGAHEHRALARDHDPPPLGANSRVHDPDVNREREPGRRRVERVRALSDVLRGDLVIDVDDLRIRVDFEDHAFHRGDVRPEPEVRREGDDHSSPDGLQLLEPFADPVELRPPPVEFRFRLAELLLPLLQR